MIEGILVGKNVITVKRNENTAGRDAKSVETDGNAVEKNENAVGRDGIGAEKIGNTVERKESTEAKVETEAFLGLRNAPSIEKKKTDEKMIMIEIIMITIGINEMNVIADL